MRDTFAELVVENGKLHDEIAKYKQTEATLTHRLNALEPFFEMVSIFMRKHPAKEYLLQIEGDDVWDEIPVTRGDMLLAMGSASEA